MDGCSVMLCFVGITFPRDFLQATFSFVEEWLRRQSNDFWIYNYNASVVVG
jgi:hypothetical protein